MPIQVSCPQCERSYKLKDETAGKRFKCKECGATVQVPAPVKAKAAHSAKPKARRTKPAEPSKQRDDDFASVLAGVTEDDYRGEHGELPPLPPRTKLEPQEKASKRKQRVLAREETLEERQRPVSTSDNEGRELGVVFADDRRVDDCVAPFRSAVAHRRHDARNVYTSIGTGAWRSGCVRVIC